MKFKYEKKEPAVHTPDSCTTHTFTMLCGDVETGFKIEASRLGVIFYGDGYYMQPVDEEMKIPEEFREFMVRLSSAFDLAWQEQEKHRKETQARQAILEI